MKAKKLEKLYFEAKYALYVTMGILYSFFHRFPKKSIRQTELAFSTEKANENSLKTKTTFY